MSCTLLSTNADLHDGHQTNSCCRVFLRGQRAPLALILLLLIVHALLLAWSASCNSPTWDEVGHLAAGVSHWHFGRFDLYRVNPPLVRVVATVPVVLSRPKTDWTLFTDAPGMPWALPIGAEFITANGQRSFWFFTLARWACIPLSLLGAYICFRWAGELYGRPAGLMALILWCFSPNILAHAQLITPDAGAAALGVAAAYAFWHWLKWPEWGRALVAGIVLGLAELTKATWVVLFPLWPILWVICRWPERRTLSAAQWRRQAAQLTVIMILAVYLINLGYGFEGSFQKLGNYHFVSKTLCGTPSGNSHARSFGNRFADSWLSALPIPLPKNYVMGIDLQKRDFENKMWSYLRGEWRHGGWWYYYLCALAIKVPLGTWLLAVLALLVGLFRRGYSVTWRDELVLLAPAAVVLTLVSSQTGFNHHLRYVLPVLPFAFIWMSKIARSVDLRDWRIVSMAGVALVWSVTGSLYVYPHSLSYFNQLVGGPKGGHYHLVNSNIDWGQDLFYLKRWLDDHPEAGPLSLAHDMPLVDPKLAGIQSAGRPPAELPEPGWYAVSVNQIHSRSGAYEYFLHFDPVGMAGYSIYIYHVTLDEANRVRRELGMGQLPADWQSRKGDDNG